MKRATGGFVCSASKGPAAPAGSVFIQSGNRIRTGDLNLGKVALYQLSYARAFGLKVPDCDSVQVQRAGPGGPAQNSLRQRTLGN